jgi:hypothetical protein
MSMNVQEETGLGGVNAKSSRVLAKRLSNEFGRDAVHQNIMTAIFQFQAPRCLQCGIPVLSSNRIPCKASYTEKTGIMKDYIRIPTRINKTNGNFDSLSDFIFCTAPCGLRYIYETKPISTSYGVDDYHRYLWKTFGIDEPVIAAPSGDVLSYRCQVLTLTPPSSVTPQLSLTAPNNDTNQIGLSFHSFYYLLSRIDLQAYKIRAPLFIPPTKEEELALEKKNVMYTKYYYRDGLPAHVLQHLDPYEVHLDANADSDGETDFSTDTVHPSPASSVSSKK